MDQDVCTYRRDDFTINTDKNRLDLNVVHGYLSRSYWCPGIPKHVLAKAIRHSLCFGLYAEETQIGFARVVTDFARYAYLCDVFVLKSYRGKGLGTWLIECVVHCPLLEGIRVMRLGTRDAHGLYEKFGFEQIENPQGLMELKFEMAWFRPDQTEE